MEMEFILYVNNQESSSRFYSKILNKIPELEVPGMTEFALTEFCKLGLMPVNGIAKILGAGLPHPKTGIGIPRCELYLRAENLEKEFENALKNGATLISPIQNRDWGDRVGYLADLDGHIIALYSAVKSDDQD